MPDLSDPAMPPRQIDRPERLEDFLDRGNGASLRYQRSVSMSGVQFWFPSAF